MGWLWLVGSLKTEVAFQVAKEPYEIDYILQKRPIFLRSLLIMANPCYDIMSDTILMREALRGSVLTYDTMSDTIMTLVWHYHDAMSNTVLMRESLCGIILTHDAMSDSITGMTLVWHDHDTMSDTIVRRESRCGIILTHDTMSDTITGMTLAWHYHDTMSDTILMRESLCGIILPVTHGTEWYYDDAKVTLSRHDELHCYDERVTVWDHIHSWRYHKREPHPEAAVSFRKMVTFVTWPSSRTESLV